jgi:transcriptional regulator with XRE-family HTH domain
MVKLFCAFCTISLHIVSRLCYIVEVAVRYTKNSTTHFAGFQWKGCDKSVTTDIGKKLQQLRKGRKLSQQELADKLGVSRATVSNYEVGRRAPHLSELQRFAEFYGVGLDHFGVASRDEVFDLLTRAKAIFESDAVTKETKDDLHISLMQLYLSMKQK